MALVTCEPGSTLIDYSAAVIDYASARQVHGYEGVIGYLPWNPDANERSCLNHTLVDRILAAGMCWAGVWELSETRATSSYDVGLSDGRYACASARGLGAAPGSVVFYTVDFDATAWTVQEYGKGFRDACNEYGFVSGVYGGVRIIDYMVGQVAVNPIGWQTEAWSGGRVSAHAHVLQRTYVKPIGGTDHNDVLKPILVTAGAGHVSGGDDLQADERAWLIEVTETIRKMVDPYQASVNEAADGRWVGGQVGGAAPTGTRQIIAAAPGSFTMSAEAATTLRQLVVPGVQAVGGQVNALAAQLAAVSASMAALVAKVDRIGGGGGTTQPVPIDVEQLARKVLAEMMEELRAHAMDALNAPPRVDPPPPRPGPSETGGADEFEPPANEPDFGKPEHFE